MTESQFDVQVNLAKRRIRKLIVLAVAMFILLNAAGILLMMRLYSKPNGVLLVGVGVVAVWTVTAGALFISFKKAVRDFPTCPSCRGVLTERERTHLVSKRTCPFCQAPIMG